MPKSDDTAVEIDKTIFQNKDAILDKMMKKSDSGTGVKILELELTETFHKDEEETYLTAEDTIAANEEAEKEKLLREEGKFVEQRWSHPQPQLGSTIPELHGPPSTGLVDMYCALFCRRLTKSVSMERPFRIRLLLLRSTWCQV